MGVCGCVGGGGWMPGRVGVSMRERVTLLIPHITFMRHIVSSFMASLAAPHFSTLSHKHHDFRKKFLNIKCVF
jgi:hypothetical protein